jgi:hypothetical protein
MLQMDIDSLNNEWEYNRKIAEALLVVFSVSGIIAICIELSYYTIGNYTFGWGLVVGIICLVAIFVDFWWWAQMDKKMISDWAELLFRKEMGYDEE